MAIVGNGAFEPSGGIWEDFPLYLQEGSGGNPGVFRSNIKSSSSMGTEWHHVASTCDGTVTKLYLDGV